jgi:competence protein ComEC
LVLDWEETDKGFSRDFCVFLSPKSIVETLDERLGEQKEGAFLWLPVLLGIGAAFYFSLLREPPLFLTGIFLGGVAVLALRLLIWVRKGKKSELLFLLFLVAAALFWIGAGFALAQARTHFLATPMLEREIGPVKLMGRVKALDEKEAGKGWVAVLDQVSLESYRKLPPPEKRPNSIRLSGRGEPSFAAGDTVDLLAKLRPASSPLAPGGFDFQRFYYFEGIGANAIALGKVTVRETAQDGFFLERLRQKIAARIDAVLPPRIAAITTALMTGERAAISEDDWTALRGSGLAHIISISGLHVALFAAPVFFFVRLFLAAIPPLALNYPIKKIAAAVALVSCALYVALVVPSVPTYRALMMTGIALIAIMTDRSPFSLRLLSFAAIVVLVFSPESVWSASFQMSFAAVLALVAVADWMRPYWSEWARHAGFFRKAGLYLGGALLTTCVASLATAPFSSFHFQQIASYSVLGNGLAMPLSGLVIMPMMIAVFLAMPFGLEFYPLQAMGWGIEKMLDVAHEVTALPGSVIETPVWPFSALVALVFAGLFLFLLNGKLRAIAVVPFLLFLVLLAGGEARPVVQVSPSGKLILVRDGDTVILSSRRAEKSVAENWIRQMGLSAETRAEYFPRSGVLTLPEGGKISCDDEACRIEVGGIKLATGDDQYALEQDCKWADVIITPSRFYSRDCPYSKIYDAGRLARSEGLSIREDGDSLIIQTVREKRGNRLWTAGVRPQ